MKNITIYTLVLSGSLFFCTDTMLAQKKRLPASIAKSKKVENYQKLKNLGYTEKEICEDLGNANFLLEKYENAVFWYERLMDLEHGKSLSESYKKRYQYALEQTTGANSLVQNDHDWVSQIRDDYELKRAFEARRPTLSSKEVHRELEYQPNLRSLSLDYLVEYEREKAFKDENASRKKHLPYPDYEEPIAVTANRQTAYFSKAVYVKPATGIFSKKEIVYKIYRTDKIDGQWKNVQEVALAPKHFSAKHPAISEDGKRLYFASNMPGSFGEYDIYAADIDRKGIAGQSKNLGTKVNTKKNDLYPSIVEGNTLVFASEGRDGYGGLDLYMAEVGQKKVGWATNLGSPINSDKDEFSMYLMAEKGIGYVLSNRGKNKNELQQVAFSYAKDKKIKFEEEDHNLFNALNNKLKIDYTTTLFDDQ